MTVILEHLILMSSKKQILTNNHHLILQIIWPKVSDNRLITRQIKQS